MTTDRVVTSREAALMCGVSPAAIRMWVFRGHLKPLAVSEVRGRHLYYARDVEACNEERKRLAEHRLDEAVINEGSAPASLGELSADQIDVLRAGLFHLLSSSSNPTVIVTARELVEHLTEVYLANFVEAAT